MTVLAIAGREVRGYFDLPIAYVVLPAFLGLSALYLFILQPFFVTERATLRPFFEFAPFLFTLFVPAITMRLLAEERRVGTLEVLLSWPVSDWSVAAGKFLGACALLALAVLGTVSFPLSIAALGDLDFGPVIGGYLGLLLLGGAYCALGLLISALTSNQIIAFIGGFLLCFAFYIVGRAAPLVPPALAGIAEFISFDQRFAAVARGVLDLRDVAFFVAVTLAGLGATAEVLHARRWRGGATRRPRVEAALALGLLAIIAVLLNTVAGQHPARLDLTADGRYTLAPITLLLLDELDGPIEARAFLPSRVQAPYAAVVRAMADKLEEYRAASGGRLRVWTRDPTDPLDDAARAELAEEAAGHGIAQADLQIIEADRRVRQRVWYGVALLYRDRQVVVPPVERAADVEFALTRALREAVRGPAQRPTIGVATGHGEVNLIDSPLAPLLESSGALQSVSLNGEAVPPEVDALVIVGPRRRYSERTRYVIDQFLLRGKALVALLDFRPPSEVFPEVLVPVTSGLEPLLADYGLVIDETRTVLDRQRALPAPIGRDARGQMVTVHHPLFVRMDDLNRDHSVTSTLPALPMPFAAPIDASTAAVKGLRVEPLVRSGAGSVLRREVRALDPTPLAEPPADPELERPGPAVVAVAARGTLTSAFAGKAHPAPPTAENPLGPPTRPDPPFVENAQGEAKLVVATSGTRLLATGQNALVFLQNAIDWAVTDTDLAALRARGADDPPLAPTDGAVRAWVKYGNLLGPSLLLWLLGLMRRARRRRAA